jgi:hypothetical protein
MRPPVLGRRACLCCGVAAGIAAAPPARAQARPFCRYSLKDGWTDTGPTEYVTRHATGNDRSGIPQLARRINEVLSIQVQFDIFIAEREDNAFAAVAGGRKILVVDVDFLEKLNRKAGTQWAAIQVVAHEIGHHIAGFSQDRHRGELSADYWSGQVLQRLGSAREAATAAILTVGTDFDSPSHPNKQRRAQTIGRGWDDARRKFIDRSFCIDGC